MRGFLVEHLGVFDPDEIRTLVAAFDKAWEAAQAIGVFDKAKADSARAILAKHIIAAAKDGEYDQGRLAGELFTLATSPFSPASRRNRGRATTTIRSSAALLILALRTLRS